MLLAAARRVAPRTGPSEEEARAPVEGFVDYLNRGGNEIKFFRDAVESLSEFNASNTAINRAELGTSNFVLPIFDVPVHNDIALGGRRFYTSHHCGVVFRWQEK